MAAPPGSALMNAWLAGGGKKRAHVPEDLESLGSDELVQLVKQLAAERDGLERDAKRQAVASTPRTTGAAAASSTATPASAATAPTDKEVQAILGRLRVKAEKAIKKTKHSQARKPYTEVTEGVGNKALALALMRGQSAFQKSDTARMTRWLFDEDVAISRWLGIERQIHPVAFDGKVLCFAGQRPSIYAYAGMESLEVKWEGSSNLLTLKFRTFFAGSGRPGFALFDDF